MAKIISQSCPRCNSHSLYKYGKDKYGNQKYQCRMCKHQFAPDSISYGSKGAKPLPPEQRKYPSCPVCGKSAFLHHDYDDYSNYRCSDKKCNHSFFQAKSTVKLPPSMSNLIGKEDFSHNRYIRTRLKRRVFGSLRLKVACKAQSLASRLCTANSSKTRSFQVAEFVSKEME